MESPLCHCKCHKSIGRQEAPPLNDIVAELTACSRCVLQHNPPRFDPRVSYVFDGSDGPESD